MGLWLKCPVCNVRNSVSMKVCAWCGASLENLPPEKRIYILDSAGSATTEPAAVEATAPPVAAVAPEVPVAEAPPAPEAVTEAPSAPAPEAAPKKARGAKKPRKKKS